jgi:preprotein translocase subunit SecG
MNMLNVILNLVLYFSAAAIVLLVLVQRGKGADAGAGFGAGASGTVFGARGATTALSRATAIAAAIFMIDCLLLTYMARQTTTATSVLDEVKSETSGAPGATTPSAATPATTAPAATSEPAAAPAPASGDSTGK